MLITYPRECIEYRSSLNLKLLYPGLILAEAILHFLCIELTKPKMTSVINLPLYESAEKQEYSADQLYPASEPYLEIAIRLTEHE